MKRTLLGYFIIFFINLVCAQNFSLDGKYPFQQESLLDIMTIKENEIIIEYKDNKPDEYFSFDVRYYNGMPFIELSEKLPSEVAEWWVFEENINIQTNNLILFLAFKEKSNTIFAFTKGFNQDRPLTLTKFDERGSVYKDCTSFLIEKEKSYSVENLRKLVVDTPWVEGVPGDGIGEGFTIETAGKNSGNWQYLMIMNGYISYDKPYLYKQNGRVKKIKVTGVKSRKSKILDILDTPHPQTVDISFLVASEDVRIEIADIYKGSKYEDTCLHYCISHSEKIIPYENSIGK